MRSFKHRDEQEQNTKRSTATATTRTVPWCLDTCPWNMESSCIQGEEMPFRGGQSQQKSRACGCAITIFGIACALEFKPRHWNKWSKNLVAFVRQKRIKIKLMSWRLCLKCCDETLEYARNWNTTWRRRIIAIAHHGNPPLLLLVAMGHADSQGGMMPHS
jgi:hypothetical protein